MKFCHNSYFIDYHLIQFDHSTSFSHAAIWSFLFDIGHSGTHYPVCSFVLRDNGEILKEIWLVILTGGKTNK